MKNFVCLLFSITIAIALMGCTSSLSNLPSTENYNSPQEAKEVNSHPVQVTYEVAFNFVKQCEDNIIDSNKNDFNKYNESAAEKIIYSNEYAALYCSYWHALEVLYGESDSRFEKSKMRWQIDFSTDEWTTLLIDALKTGELNGFQDEYARLYTEEVFPEVKYRWEKGIE